MNESVTPPGDPAPQCSTQDCERTDLIKSAGLCRRCYQLMRAGRDPANPLRNRRHGERCTHPGCEEPYFARDLCQRHYDLERRSNQASSRRSREPRKRLSGPGKPLRTEEETRSLRIAFLWASIDRRAPDECWPWKRKPTPGGYGQLRWLEGQTTAHRAMYEVTHGSIPEFPDERTDIDHTCHDPGVCKLKTKCPHRLCCNPAHLEAVPASENRRRGDVSRPGNGGRPGSGCRPGCTCHRHREAACLPGCTCGKHRSSACAPGCTCSRHISRPNGGRPLPSAA